MPTVLEGDMLARDAQMAVVVSRFNDFITRRLLEGAIEALTRHGGDAQRLTVAWVPGAFELPVTALRLAKTGKYAAVVCLGCVIKGATDHYDHVVANATRGISEVGLQTGVPTILGVITADTVEHAIERAGCKQGNTGEKAMLAAIEMVNLFKKM